MTKIDISDEELALLDGRVGETLQEHVSAAVARLAAASAFPDLTPRQAGLIADAVSEARLAGRLVWHHRRLRYCPLCEKHGGYALYKSGPRKGRPNYDRPLSMPGIELAYRFVTIEGSVAMGGCQDCIRPVIPHLKAALVGVPAALPDMLVTEGAQRFNRFDNRRCTACGWTGHEGEMGRRRTLFDDGTYPATCPSCNAENRPFGPRIIETVDGFTVVHTDA